MADDPTRDDGAAPELAPASPPQAAADKPADATPAEPIKGDVSRTDEPGAGVSAATGQVTPPASAAPPRRAAAPGAPTEAAGAEAAAKPPASAAKAAHPAAPAPPSGPPDPPPPAGLAPPAFIAALEAAVPGAVSAVSYWVGDWTIIVPVARLLDVARHLHGAGFDYCPDVTATDWPPRSEGRFDVVYCLYSMRDRVRIRVKVRAAEHQPVPSVTGIWPAANWLEREVFDLFGVNFTGHPDRRRILMPEDWQGHPQRKDYPLEGPGELLMENPLDWLKLRQARDEADIE